MTKGNFFGLCAGSSIIAATALFASMPAWAQAAPGSAAPRGSYLQSCQNISYSAGVLTAQCKTANGGLTVSTLEPAFCAKRSDIANVHGTLGCIATPGTWGKGGATPNGSYKASCRGVYVELTPSPVLWAHCDRPDSGPQGPFKGDKFYGPSSLNLDQCEVGKEITNVNGQLVCTPRKGPPPIRRM
jgi:hypothetical protein